MNEYQVDNGRGFQLWCRPNTFDEGIIKRYIECYFKLAGAGRSGETWLDLGAHIGGFTVAVAPQVKKVIAVEADPDTAAVLGRNIHDLNLSNVEICIAAVVGTKHETQSLFEGSTSKVRFYRTERGQFGTQNAQGSLVRNVGGGCIEVDSVIFDDLLIGQENVCVKMDIEGGEREILDHTNSWSKIQRFILEFHTTHHCAPHHPDDKAYYNKVMHQFSENFRNVVSTLPKNSSPWTWYIYGEK